MRAAPLLELHVTRFGVWRAGALTLAATVCAVLAAWCWMHPAPVPIGVIALTVLGMLLAAATALPSFIAHPLTLRRGAGQWQLAVVGQPSAPMVPGMLSVALDFGGWMLLRFVPETGHGRARWIALQRWGLEPQWHALRCAVHAPPRRQPDAGVTADV